MNSKKKFASDVIFYGISSGLISLFGLITLPILTKTLSHDLYDVEPENNIRQNFLNIKKF